MRLVRKNIFETNSSSTHSLVIPKNVDNKEYCLYDSLDHNYGFGRDECRLVDDWDEKLAYLYMTFKYLVDYRQVDIDLFKQRINGIYKDVYNIVEYKPYKNGLTPQDIFNYIDNNSGLDAYIDHLGEFAKKEELLDKVLNDDEFLKRFIFNKAGYIVVGSDEYRGYNIKTIGFEYDYEDYYVNDKGERPPKSWYTKNGCLKKKYFDKIDEYKILSGDFWTKLHEYEKDNDVYLKGN